jgi:hypothetical protein
MLISFVFEKYGGREVFPRISFPTRHLTSTRYAALVSRPSLISVCYFARCKAIRDSRWSKRRPRGMIFDIIRKGCFERTSRMIKTGRALRFHKRKSNRLDILWRRRSERSLRNIDT